MTDADARLHTDDLAGRGSGIEPTGNNTVVGAGSSTGMRQPQGAGTATDTADPDTFSWSELLGNTDEFASQWDRIQAGFVDEPRRAVEQADGLVAQLVQRLAESFAEQRSRLEDQWSRGDNVDTEDLRVTLRRYRSFFNVLLER